MNAKYEQMKRWQVGNNTQVGDAQLALQYDMTHDNACKEEKKKDING